MVEWLENVYRGIQLSHTSSLHYVFVAPTAWYVHGLPVMQYCKLCSPPLYESGKLVETQPTLTLYIYRHIGVTLHANLGSGWRSWIWIRSNRNSIHYWWQKDGMANWSLWSNTCYHSMSSVPRFPPSLLWRQLIEWGQYDTQSTNHDTSTHSLRCRRTVNR